MARNKSHTIHKAESRPAPTVESARVMPHSYDPTIALLFASSLGPVKTLDASILGRTLTFGLPNSQEIDEALQESDSTVHSDVNTQTVSITPIGSGSGHAIAGKQNRKRKRNDEEDDIEGKYMRRLVQEEARENNRERTTRNKKHQKSQMRATEIHRSPDENTSEAESVQVLVDHEERQLPIEIPKHESLATVEAAKEDTDIEKASRTVFLANVSTLAIKSKSAKKVLLDHLASCLSSLPRVDTTHKVESLRFRSTAFSSTGAPKKAAYAKKELMDSTTKSTNAYAVYSTQQGAREASKRLNGTLVLDRHLRVDSVAHPAKQDHQRCVFVGNLGFVDDMTTINAAEDEENNKRPRKATEPADIEEGMWRQFGKAGIVESVRVVRDKTTRVGKGFAYVQFTDANAVEKALSYNEKKFPPMLPRTLRVTRAKNVGKTTRSKDRSQRHGVHSKATKTMGTYVPKISSKTQSLSGRAGKLLGRAKAAQFRNAVDEPVIPKRQVNEAIQATERVAFEGYRASSKQGRGTMKLAGSGKKQGDRSSRRGADFKRSGGQKRT